MAVEVRVAEKVRVAERVRVAVRNKEDKRPQKGGAQQGGAQQGGAQQGASRVLVRMGSRGWRGGRVDGLGLEVQRVGLGARLAC